MAARSCFPAAWLGLVLGIVAARGAAARADDSGPGRGSADAPPVAAQPAVSAPAAAGPDYVIGPGDVLQVFVWRMPELTATVPVRPDGRISTPLVEDMVAVGKPPSVLARDIERVLAEYVRTPQVNVIVTQPAGSLGQVKVIGQVARPGAMPYRKGMTVLDALLAVGGVSQYAAPNRARIVRGEGGRQEELRIRLGALVNDGDMRQNVELQPGDVLVVPESRF